MRTWRESPFNSLNLLSGYKTPVPPSTLRISLDRGHHLMQRIFFFLFLFPIAQDVAFSQQASLMLNEINPNISGSNDLIELIAVNGGSLNGLSLQQAPT